MRKAAPRLLIAGTGSGCGKTTVTCALLQALKNRGSDIAAFKCGPDYIDPMFHSEIIGTDSGNLDLFFAGKAGIRSLFLAQARELNLIEGVMGYYDGLSLSSDEASSFALAAALDAPVLLVASGRGRALSLAAEIKGFLHFRQPSRIAGLLLNQVSPSVYPGIKSMLEAECGIPVYGYLPALPDCELASRHLGLVTAAEVDGLRDKMQRLAFQAEKCIDLDGMIRLMQAQAPLEAAAPAERKIADIRIALARDRAFCFYDRGNLSLLQALGAELIPFSPLADEALPPCDGLYLGGGYPELYAERLSENASMRAAVRDAVKDGLPTIAECGGFMYLTEEIDHHPMAAVLPGGCADQGHLVRFGYITMEAEEDSLLFSAGSRIRGHEFHHWDADFPGNTLQARKPSGKAWACAHVSETLYAGFPHLALYSNPESAERFIRKCAERRRTHDPEGD